MIVSFITPKRISYIDLISMGGSEKAGDDTKIGQFCSGLKYAMALMLRNQVTFTVKTYNSDGALEEQYIIGEYLIEDLSTNKEKKLIEIIEKFSGNIHKTGYSIDLGLNWEPWMILREIYSNTLDEGGSYKNGAQSLSMGGTIMELEFEDDSIFGQVWMNKHLYINEQLPLFKVSSQLEAYKNEEKYLRIYKQGILVYEDREKYSEYAWGIKFGEIDERRILSNVTAVLVKIADIIGYSDNEAFLRTLIRSEEWVNENDFLCNSSFWGTISDTARDVIYELYLENDEVYTYDFLYKSAKDASDSPIGGRKIKSVGDHIWNYSSDIVVHDTKAVIEKKVDEQDLKSQMENLYTFPIECEVKAGDISGSEVIADKYNKCILVGETFDYLNEEHFATFLIQYLDLTQEGNLLKNLSLLLVRTLTQQTV